jgi:hypothetical protein
MELVKGEVWRYWAVHHTSKPLVLSPMCIVTWMGKEYIYCFSVFRSVKPDGGREHFRWTCVLAHPDGKMLVDKVALTRVTPSSHYVSFIFFCLSTLFCLPLYFSVSIRVSISVSVSVALFLFGFSFGFRSLSLVRF